MEYAAVAGALVVLIVLVSLVSRGRGGDPSTSVRDFSRALSALERTESTEDGADDVGPAPTTVASGTVRRHAGPVEVRDEAATDG